MKVLIYQKRFVPLVESHKKDISIRKLPKKIPEHGTILSHRYWSGRPYNSKQTIILEDELKDMWKIEIDEQHNVILLGKPICKAGIVYLW